MIIEIKGVVVRETNIGDGDKLLDIFTDNGMVTAVAKGVRSIKSKNMSSAQIFCYASYVLYSKNGYYWIKEVSLIENFFNIRLSLENTAVASYICEAVEHFATTDEPSGELLSLVLNCFYALSVDRFDRSQVKAVFEFRAAAILGFMPMVSACAKCGGTDSWYTFDIMNGHIICDRCRKKMHNGEVVAEDIEHPEFRTPIFTVSEGVRQALLYISSCKTKDMLSFSLSEPDMKILSDFTEKYFINHMDKSFRTLDFYHELTQGKV